MLHLSDDRPQAASATGTSTLVASSHGYLHCAGMPRGRVGFPLGHQSRCNPANRVRFHVSCPCSATGKSGVAVARPSTPVSSWLRRSHRGRGAAGWGRYAAADYVPCSEVAVMSSVEPGTPVMSGRAAGPELLRRLVAALLRAGWSEVDFETWPDRHGICDPELCRLCCSKLYFTNYLQCRPEI